MTRPIVRLLAWSAVAALPAFVSGRSVAQAVDRGFLAGRTWVGVAWLLPMAVAGALASVAARHVNPLIGDVVEPFRDRLVRGVVASNLRHSVRSGAEPDAHAVAQLVGQTDGVRDLTASLLGSVVSLSTTLVAAVAGLVTLDRWAAAVVMLPVVVTLVLIAALVPTLVARTRELLDADERIATVAASTALAVRDICACGAEDRACAENDDAVQAHAAATRRMARAVALRTTVGAIGAQAPLILLLAATPWLLRSGGLTVGGVLGALTYATASLQPALGSAVEAAAVSWVRLRVTLARLAPRAPAGAPAPRPRSRLATPSAGFDLTAADLSFSYGRTATPIVDGLHLTIPHGDHLAVVGPSGVGKSTLMDLLVGLTAPDRGTVRLGGVPLGHMALARLRRLIALVPQEAYVFAGTLRENLTYLRPDATRADLDRAARETGLLPVVERLGGYDAVLGGDHDLSAGERQLVVLTRVWLSPAEIVVLDESTCHLDPAAEASAELAFRRRQGTLVVVAHRISSARRADRVLLMDGGSLRVGSHRDLLATSPLYADLVGEWRADVEIAGAQRLVAASVASTVIHRQE